MGALTCFCNLYTCGIIKSGKHITQNLNESDCFPSQLQDYRSLMGGDGASSARVAEANHRIPGSGSRKNARDPMRPVHIWPMCIHLPPDNSAPGVSLKTFPPVEMALDNYSWKLISIKQEQDVLAGETLSESCGKQKVLN